MTTTRRAFTTGLMATAGATAARAQAPRTIRIGALAGLSGLGAQIGQWMVDGANAAIGELNRGAATPRYALVTEDSQWNPQKGVEGYNKLVNVDRIDVLLSGGSAVMEAIAPLADQRQLVLMNTGAQSPKMAGIGKFTFSVLQLADFDIRILSRHAYRELGYRNVALMYVNNDTGKFNQAEFAKAFEREGGKIAASEAFRPNETNYGAQLAKVRAGNADAIYIVGTPAEMPFAVRQTRQMAPGLPILSYAGMESQEFLDAAGDAANAIVYTTTAFDPTRDDPRIKNFVDAYRALRNAAPTSPYIGYGYDAVQIVHAGLARSGGETGDKLRAAIHAIKRFPGVTGDNDFQEDGTVAKAVAIRRVEAKQFRTVKIVEP